MGLAWTSGRKALVWRAACSVCTVCVVPGADVYTFADAKATGESIRKRHPPLPLCSTAVDNHIKCVSSSGIQVASFSSSNPWCLKINSIKYIVVLWTLEALREAVPCHVCFLWWPLDAPCGVGHPVCRFFGLQFLTWAPSSASIQS